MNKYMNEEGEHVYEFKDMRGFAATIQDAVRSDGQDAIWLGLGDNERRLLLSPEIAGQLWPVLKHFAERGEI